MDRLKSHPDRFLVDHLLGTAQRACEKAKKINWEPFGISNEQALKLVELCALCHDFAKASKDFQDYMADPKSGKRTSHAPLSSLISFSALQNNGFDLKLSCFGYFVVRNHHENLKNFELIEENIYQLEKQFQTIPESFLNWIKAKTNTHIPDIKTIDENIKRQISKLTFNTEFNLKDYILLHTLTSILVSSDHEDAALKDLKIDIIPSLTIELVEQYKKSIPRDNQLYELRNQFHEEVDRSLQTIKSRILSMTAPTGIGKTLANIKVALSKATENSTIVYALPFINIIDQTIETLHRILEKTEYDATTILPYHHLADYEYKNKDYEQHSVQRILVENWYAQVIVTTFVSLFESLLTNRKVPFFYKLLNSVIILDEVQSIPHKYWEPIAQILNELTQFGTTIILSTATQPMILNNTENIVKRNYSEKINRTKVYFHGEVEYAEFLNVVEQIAKETLMHKKTLLVVLNTIRESKELFKYLYEKIPDDNLFYLSSNVIPKQRMERIRKLKQIKGQPVICISTQVIEAGVDISFDKVIRDEGPLDSIIQVSGRCNRAFESHLGEVHIYRIFEQKENIKRSFSSYIYDSFLLNITREVTREKQSCEEKEFPHLIREYFEKIKKRGNTDQDNLLELISPLQFEEIGSRFHLIDRKYQVAAIFVEYDDYAVSLREKLNQVMKNQSIEKFEKLAQIKKLLRQMAMYMIDVPILKEDLTGALMVENGFLIITKDNLKYWYNDQTGFERSEATMIF
ncbi:CRISPR-associated helicase Cas3' [Thermotoga profunda]|uniref:CRISPR-associated helicase Cas3' n=1 Tax=Thermotoga profunda TaxID=1508420 RepID=UPI001493F1FE|nr:CRISPR-associated helicase Cas3' [Thermotoga profunda]